MVPSLLEVKVEDDPRFKTRVRCGNIHDGKSGTVKSVEKLYSKLLDEDEDDDDMMAVVAQRR